MELFRGSAGEIAALAIGDLLYNFDGNRRVYLQKNCGPSYAHHFEAHEIFGETRQSWIVGPYRRRVNKKTLASALEYADRGYFTKTAMEEDIFVAQHAHRIAKAVERATSVQLREIAEIIGYEVMGRKR